MPMTQRGCVTIIKLKSAQLRHIQHMLDHEEYGVEKFVVVEFVRRE